MLVKYLYFLRSVEELDYCTYSVLRITVVQELIHGSEIVVTRKTDKVIQLILTF
jgi:hypothetical protein